MNTILRFGEMKAEQFVQGVNNNWIIYSPLPYAKQHSSGIDDSVVISGLNTKEIVDADLDVAIDLQYDYTYSISTDNKLKISFSKSKHSDKTSAMEALKCVAVTYALGNLKPNGEYYKVVARNSHGEEVHRTTPMTLDKVDKVISTFDDTRDISASGFLSYHVVRDFIVE
ncbi:hypothetical protein [Paenibacillus xylanexedens]|uniref:hypothetical protein n=1 Tax=Paenibacillus xylanexedens TaxID=528191 RepID=UPI000F53F1A4|nr:hypothetical protein [Paenibacillus xylanexedens]RPK23981.1 hypothetical protein EDO6_04919 [Paenibacillus xylanexedens]